MNSFLSACGTRRPLQLEVENQINHRVEIRSLDQPFAVIGRDRNCDIVFDEKQISRRHAYLQMVGGRVFWVDLESRKGTIADGEARKAGWLGDGQVITIGPYMVRQLGRSENPSDRVEAGPPQGSPLSWRTLGDDTLPDVTIEFLNGPSKSKSWPIRRVLSLIGTHQRCKFRLTDRTIEPFHCAIMRTPLGLFVVDLLGGQGIRVNEGPARSAPFRDGDMLQIGRYRIRVHYQAEETDAEIQVMGQTPSVLTVRPTELSLQIGVPGFPSFATPLNPDVEILPFAPGVGVPALMGRPELTDSVLVPLVSQFGMMQQQMFDQFQQTMNMLVQMFGQMHQSQMELMRQEFDRLNELTKEMNELKTELSEMTRKQAEATASASAGVTQPAMKPNAAPSTLKPPLRPERRPTDRRLSPTSTPPKSNARLQPEPATESAELTPQGERDVIFWLHERITSIQNERESRWQKILKLIPGTS